MTDYMGLFYIRDYMALFCITDYLGLFYIRYNMGLFFFTDYIETVLHQRLNVTILYHK